MLETMQTSFKTHDQDMERADLAKISQQRPLESDCKHDKHRKYYFRFISEYGHKLFEFGALTVERRYYCLTWSKLAKTKGPKGPCFTYVPLVFKFEFPAILKI